MEILFLESYLRLLQMEIAMAIRNLSALYSFVKNQAVKLDRHGTSIKTESLCHAIDLACLFYPKRVLCLQRSAATTILLRRHGIPAEMVIGVKFTPFQSHAWVEVNGAVVNDKPYIGKLYLQLERC